ncbi:hypothetical protein [Microbacterium sp. LMB2-1.2]|uniref:hypothetical protein n=1 Tax=Microbacterium sp. LMB2-1.2 TaxID=3135239 RepID=UPI00341715F7
MVDATDRYRVHEASLNYTGPKRLGSFLMPRAMVDWILKTDHKGKKVSHERLLEIAWKVDDNGTHLTARIVEPESGSAFSYELDALKGNFPPVERLYPEPSGDGESFIPVYALNPSFVGDLALMLNHGEPVRVHAPREAKLPILFEATSARALIQQNMLLR